MKIFKSLCEACYEGNDRIHLKMIQADCVNGKLRLSSSNGRLLVSYVFNKIKSNQFYYLSRSNARQLIKEDCFKFKNGKINDIKLLKDGEPIRICDTKTTIGSWGNKEVNEHFPNIDLVIPSSFKYKFNINRKMLCKALKDETHVTLKIMEKALVVYSSKVTRTRKQSRKSKPKATIPIKFIDSKFECTETMLFDVNILKTTLCIPYDDITMEFKSRVNALVIKYEDKQISVTNLAMPILINNDSI